MINYNPKDSQKVRGKSIHTSQKIFQIALFLLAGVLAVVAGIIFLIKWDEGGQAKKQAEILLHSSEWLSSSPTSSAVLLTASPHASIELGTAPIQAPKGSALNGDLARFTVIARLDIDKLNLHLPVLSETSVKALKISVCYYMGVGPGIEGNMIIVGHNYKSGAHFGRLKKLKVGDSVKLTDKNDKADMYSVYKIEHIKSDNIAVLEDTMFAKELTLITCEENGNGRLLVRCKADNQPVNN